MTTPKLNVLKQVFALTIVSMFFVTKWWFALPVDGPDKLYWGFPMVFIGEGFHTSMSFQIFVLEFIADFAAYFSFWLLLCFAIDKLLPNWKMDKLLPKFIWYLSLIFVFGFCLLVGLSNPIFHAKRNYEWRVLKTGYVLIWQNTPRP